MPDAVRKAPETRARDASAGAVTSTEQVDDAASRTAQYVPSEFVGARLDQALARMLPAHSRTRLKSWIDAGLVTVDGERWDAKRRVEGGEHIEIRPLPDAPPTLDEQGRSVREWLQADPGTNAT